MMPIEILDSAMRTLFYLGKEEEAKNKDTEHEKLYMEYTQACDKNEAQAKEIQELKYQLENSKDMHRQNAALQDQLKNLQYSYDQLVSAPVQTFRTERHGKETKSNQIQETIDAYEARIKELTKECNTLYATINAYNKYVQDKLCFNSKEMSKLKSFAEQEANEYTKTKSEIINKIDEFLNKPNLDYKQALDVPNIHVHPNVDYTKVNDILSKCGHAFDISNHMIRKALKDYENNLSAFVSSTFLPGDYVHGYIKTDKEHQDDEFVGIIRNYGKDFVELYTLYGGNDNCHRQLLILNKNASHKQIIYNSKTLTVAASKLGCGIFANKITKIEKARNTDKTKLDNILAKFGFKFDGKEMLDNQWNDVEVDTIE